jgi:hypothetical protein
MTDTSRGEDLAPCPGSDAAIIMGCTCPVMDNHHGHGFAVEGEVVFWINNDCPVHAPLPSPGGK